MLQCPWEPPVKPMLLTSDSVTLDPWREHRERGPSSQGRTSFDRRANSWDTRTFVLREKKVIFKKKSPPIWTNAFLTSLLCSHVLIQGLGAYH